MISITYNAAPALLLNDAWNGGKFSAEFGALTGLAASLTNRESRRPHALSLRALVKYPALVTEDEVPLVEAALRDADTRPVLLPFWPALIGADELGTEEDVFTAGLWVRFFADWSAFTLGARDTLAATPLNPGEWLAPVLVGRLNGARAAARSGEAVRFNFEFEEQSAPALELVPVPPEGFAPVTGLDDLPLFPERPDFGKEDPTRTTTTGVLRQRLGFGRAAAETFYAHAAPRGREFGVALDGRGALARLLKFFRDQAGEAGGFWLDDEVPCARLFLAADHPTGTHIYSFPVYAGHDIRAGDRLIFHCGGAPVFRCATGIAPDLGIPGVELVDITPDEQPDYDYRTAEVHRLLRCRFAEDRLKIEWTSPAFARATVKLIELPPELDAPEGETAGATLGRTPTRAFAYEFRRAGADADIVTRLTSFEREVKISGDVFSVAKLEHGDVRQSLNFDRDEVELRTHTTEGTPLNLLAARLLEAPLRVTIFTGEVASLDDDGHAVLTNVTTLFTGEAGKPKQKGSRLTASLLSGGKIFDQKLPRLIFGAADNFPLFTAGNALAAADWKFDALVTNPGAPGWPYELTVGSLSRTGGVPTMHANWFTGGWIEFGTADAWQRMAIVHSTGPVAGEITLRLTSDPRTALAIDDAVVLFPNYDLTLAMAVAKFGNRDNFGGHPFMPVGNPSLLKVSQNVGGGKK